MLEMRQYPSGERRVVDTERLIASDWLHHGEMDAPLIDYDLGNDASDDDESGHVVLRSE
jgi:hypothetical protein